MDLWNPKWVIFHVRPRRCPQRPFGRTNISENYAATVEVCRRLWRHTTPVLHGPFISRSRSHTFMNLKNALMERRRVDVPSNLAGVKCFPKSRKFPPIHHQPQLQPPANLWVHHRRQGHNEGMYVYSEFGSAGPNDAGRSANAWC